LTIHRKRVAKRLASGLLAGALALGGLALNGGAVSAKTPTSPTTNRISGADRYETAVKIARNQISGNDPKALVIASGESSADALAAASLTYSASNADKTAVLLVRKDSIPESVSDYISDIRLGFSALTSPSVHVIGGTSVISAEVLDGITAALAVPGDLAPAAVVRRSGDDRYGTAKAIGEVTGNTTYDDTMILVGGNSWADALVAGPLASEKGWPIALVAPSGLSGDSKTQVDNYLALTSSVKKFVIFGGPAAVPPSVEQYLVGTKLVSPANIRRIAGADRYQTALFANLYLANEVGSPWTTATVALVSGQAPWDAIAGSAWAAKNGAHVMLTPTASPELSGVTLGATLSGLATEGYPSNGTLYVLGGKAAVADSAKTAYIAASNNDLTSTLSGCDASRSSFTVTLSGKLSSGESGAFASNSATLPLFKVDGTALATATGGITVVDSPGLPTRTIYTVTVSSALTATKEIKFAGWADGTAVGAYTPTRSVAASSCVIASDLVKPTTSKVLAWSGNLGAAATTGAGAGMYIKFSEPVTLGAGGSVAAGLVKRFVGGVAASASTSGSVSPVTQLDAGGTEWFLEFNPDDTGLGNTSALDVIELSASAVKDQAGLNPALPIQGTAAADAAAPAAAVGAIRCVRTNDATVTSGVAINFPLAGTAGNLWSMSVINSRGLLIPSVVVDEVAKTITITADTMYHTSGDIATVMANQMLTDAVIGSYAVTSAAATKPTATVIPAKATGGVNTCTALLGADEPFTASANFTVTVNNVPATVTSITVDADYTSTGNISAVLATGKQIVFTTTQVGSASMLFADADDGLSDIRGTNQKSAINFTVS